MRRSLYGIGLACGILVLAALIATSGMGPVRASPASVFTVTKTADTNDGACTPADCSLREAVVAATVHPSASQPEPVWRFRGYTYRGQPGDSTHGLPEVTLRLYGRAQGEPAPGRLILTRQSDGSGFWNFYIIKGYVADIMRLEAEPPAGLAGTGVWTEDGVILDNLTVEWTKPKPEVHMNAFFFDAPTPTPTVTLTPTPSATMTKTPTATYTLSPTATDTPTTAVGQPLLWLPLLLKNYDEPDQRLVFSTYLGGGLIDFGDETVVDASGNVYVCGGTDSRDFRTTAGAYDRMRHGGRDAFVAKFDPEGRLLASTLLGGSGSESCNALTLGPDGTVYVGGGTYSADFPAPGSFMTDNAFIARFDPNLTTLVTSTLIASSHVVWGLDWDAASDLWVTGGSFTARYDSGLNQVCRVALSGGDEGYAMAAAGGYGYAVGQTFARGTRDGFVRKYDAACRPVYEMTIGGSRADWFMDVAVDGSGRAYAFGDTTSPDYPVTGNAFQPSNRGDRDGVLTVLNTAGKGWVYSSYYGGSALEYALGGGLDVDGNAYLTGVTYSNDLVTADPLQGTYAGGGDIFLAKLQVDGAGAPLPLLFGTYFGGSGTDSAYGMAVGPGGGVVLTGITGSSDYPTKIPVQSHYAGGGEDIIVTRLAFGTAGGTDCSAQTDIPQAECVALVALYQSTNGPNWSDSPENGWKVTNSPCSWTGVSCSSGSPRHVIAIDRANCNMAGTLPDLSALTRMEFLNLSSNRLVGGMPDLSALADLQWLYLYSNSLSGNIPDLSALTDLRDLGLSYNKLSGSIPDLSILPNLQRVFLHNNELSGSIPNLSALTNLQGLFLYNNHLSGSIPELAALTNLEYLALNNNQLSGNIPDISALTNLQGLHLYSNRLSGNIPDLSALTNLQQLLLADNHLSGSIVPEHLPPALHDLALDHNHLTGPIPDLSSITGLAFMDVGFNQLSGSIPDLSALANLSTLYVEGNQLSGAVPDWVCHSRVNSLRIDGNMLTAAPGCLETLEPGWAATQTVPPADVQAQELSGNSIRLSWTPILYTGDGGYYEVRCGAQSGGPYTAMGTTAGTGGKTASGLTLDGLTPAATYCCVVRAFTPAHGDQQNDLTSIDSAEVTATTSPASASR